MKVAEGIDIGDREYYTAPMAMGKRTRMRQAPLWVAATELPSAASHPFYARLNQVLREARFDDFAEALCARFYATTVGRPSLAPGIHFRLLMVGYFEGLDSERGIAWRAADSLTLRDFLGVTFPDAPPDHTTIARTRRRIALETHRAVFTWVLQRLGAAGLVKGQVLGVDATTLEANAALRSIVRRDTGEGYQAFLTQLAVTSGIATPTRADLARVDRRRKKKGSNDEWTSPTDTDAKITKMKDGRTHLAHKAEHAVDLDTGAVVAVTVQDAHRGDTSTFPDTLADAVDQLDQVTTPEGEPVALGEDIVTDKGGHSRAVLLDLQQAGFRTYISEPARRRHRWHGHAAARDAVYANRRRIRGARGVALLRRRGERLERTFAHAYDTGAMRRTHLRGHGNILKRVLVHLGAFNLGLLMRHLVGVGTPRGLQDRAVAVRAALVAAWTLLGHVLVPRYALDDLMAVVVPAHLSGARPERRLGTRAFTPGC